MKGLRSCGSTSDLLHPPCSPALTASAPTPWGYRRRSLSQPDVPSKGFSRSSSGTNLSPSRASPPSSRGSQQDLDAVVRPLTNLTSRAGALELISSQPSSALPPTALPCEVDSEKFRSRLKVALQYFHFFRDLKPNVFADLLQSATIEDFPVGRVLFKQGDLSGACYLVLTGSVGLYMEAQGVVPMTRKSGRNSSKQRMPQRRRSKSMFTTEPLGRQAQVLEVENLEVQTAEGHCHRAEEMSLGSLADTIQPGKLFGEVGFRSIEGKERRPVSAKCLEETSCVVIRKQVFTRAMKDEQKRCDEERMAFLEAHLPGMREALSSSEKSSPKGKAAISFKQAVFCKGHVFLKQNAPAEDITYIVVKGTVEFLRSELMAPPRSILSSRPGSAPEPCTRHAWNEEIGTGTVLPAGEVKQREITRRIGALASGGVFGSLAALGEVEPFTVSAESALVEVLYIGSDAKQRMPRVVAEMLKEYVSRSTIFRLGNLRVNRAVDRKRSQMRVAPSFPLLQSLFAKTPKEETDWSVMSKVSHAIEPSDEKRHRPGAKVSAKVAPRRL
mmetsp:Transcript_59419/g.96958  ORF Transcript_59419/g.96958 Transcript_59419/m.96958 type:complete len:556 (+) Transcript_59419:66-1733(+)